MNGTRGSGAAAITYIHRILSVISAAFAHSQLVSPRIFMKRTWIEKHAKVTKPPRRVAIPTDKEFRLITGLPMSEALYRWMAISLGTGARPEAALDLRPEQRIDGLLDLLPPVTRRFGEYDPDYLEGASAALNAWLEDYFTSHTPLTDLGRRDPTSGKYVAKSRSWMVGGTGIEPVTPTMSTGRLRSRPPKKA